MGSGWSLVSAVGVVRALRQWEEVHVCHGPDQNSLLLLFAPSHTAAPLAFFCISQWAMASPSFRCFCLFVYFVLNKF